MSTIVKDYPTSGASVEIFREILKSRTRKNQSLYWISATKGYSYTNVRRVYLRYVKDKTDEQLDKILQEMEVFLEKEKRNQQFNS